MIRFENVHLATGKKNNKIKLFDGLNVLFRSDRQSAVLIPACPQRLALIKMILGTTSPDSGFCHKVGIPSWPLSWTNVFTPQLTGSENISFLSRLYEYKPSETLAFVKEFSGLGNRLNMKFRDMRKEWVLRISFLTALAIPFDYYICDEDYLVGDANFRKCAHELAMARMRTSSFILFTQNMNVISRFHDFYVLYKGKLLPFDDAQAAEKMYNRAYPMHYAKTANRNNKPLAEGQ